MGPGNPNADRSSTSTVGFGLTQGFRIWGLGVEGVGFRV